MQIKKPLRHDWLSNVRSDLLARTVVAQTLISQAIASSIIAGVNGRASLVMGKPESSLTTYTKAHAAGLMVIGAYSQARIRQLIMGSTTTTLLRTSPERVPVLR